MNLNKFTKAELISKFKKLDNKNSNNSNKQTFPQNIFNYLVLFKNTLYKLTILTLLIKTFKKYSIIRRIWLFINSIVMAIFGISVLDFYGLSFLASFYTELTSIVGNIVNYLTNTHFYNVLAGLFSSKIEVKQASKEILRLGTTDPISTGNETRNENSVQKNSKINEWFNKQEVIEEESSNRKYYIIAALLLLSCLTWYYYGDEIKPMVNSSIEKIKNFRRRPNNDPDNNPVDLNTQPVNPQPTLDNRINLKNRLKNLFYKDSNNTNDVDADTKVIELVDNTQPNASSSNVPDPNKTEYNTYFNTPSSSSSSNKIIEETTNKEIDTSNLTDSEINRRILMQNTGEQLDNFNNQANVALNRVNLFMKKHEDDTIPENIKLGMYKVIRAKIVSFSVLSPLWYTNWLKQPNVASIVSKFLDLKDEIENKNNISQNSQNNLDNISEKSEDIQSDTYQEVALATAEEQKAWSEDSNTSINSPYQQSPDIHSVHSPNIEQQIEQTDNTSMLGEFLQNQDEFFSNKDINQQIEEEITKGIPSIQSRTNLFEQIKNRRDDSNVIDDFNKELPEIDVDSGSSNSIDQLLPEQIPQTNLIDQLNINTNDSNVIESPNVSRLGLSPILEKIKTAFTPKSEYKVLDSGENTLQNQPSISNLLDDTNALFDDIDVDNDITTNIVENINENIPIESTNNLSENVKFDNNYVKNIWDNIDWDNRYITLLDNKSVNVDLSKIWSITKSVQITTTDNHHVIWSYNELSYDNLNEIPVKLDITQKIPKLLEHFPNTKINAVIIEDLNSNFNTIVIETQHK
uniref:Uncharacterized protein n=1 Tax=Russula foetens TaxID=131541 RepID=A0A2S0U3V5_9AGAM|nr:hypothetical protein [Russula foetens]AWB36165.1 hypothetical protein [Russula foetens]